MSFQTSGRLLFSDSVSSKVILAGEHSVLRGQPALVVPYPKFKMKLWVYESSHLQFQCDLPLIEFWEFLVRHYDLPLSQGFYFHLQSEIPVGGGLGSSAALCVLFARFLKKHFIENLKLKSISVNECARELEDFFHGTSSGLDVAVIDLEKPVVVQSGKIQKVFSFPAGSPIEQLIQKGFLLVDTGERESTKSCVKRVNEFRIQNKSRGELLDQEMGRVARAWIDLFEKNDNQISSIAPLFLKTNLIYQEWGLWTASLEKEAKKMENEGKVFRLTGAGLGGFWVVIDNSVLGPIIKKSD